MNQRTNERMPRSKTAIQDAFWQLLEQKTFTQITVKDILDLAGVGRTTFYLYYKNKRDLQEEAIKTLVDGFIVLVQKVREDTVAEMFEKIAVGYHPVFVEYFQYLRKHSAKFLALLKADIPIQPALCQALLALELEMYAPPGVAVQELDYMKNMFISGYVNIFFNWIRNGMHASEVEMARIISQYWLNYTYPGADYSIHNIYVPQVKPPWDSKEEA